VINYSIFEMVIGKFFGEYQTIKEFDWNERQEIDLCIE